jgi:hypothetical protein
MKADGFGNTTTLRVMFTGERKTGLKDTGHLEIIQSSCLKNPVNETLTKK